MSMLQVIVLAILQGFTEFLPISSSAHLALAPWLFGWPDQGLAFDIALHFGTLAAVLIYFFRDWLQIIGQGLGMNGGFDPELRRNRSLLWLVAGATIPVGEKIELALGVTYTPLWVTRPPATSEERDSLVQARAEITYRLR